MLITQSVKSARLLNADRKSIILNSENIKLDDKIFSGMSEGFNDVFAASSGIKLSTSGHFYKKSDAEVGIVYIDKMPDRETVEADFVKLKNFFYEIQR